MPVTAIVEFESEADYEDALEVPNASGDMHESSVIFEDISCVRKMVGDYFKVYQQDGSYDRVGERNDGEIITVY